MKDVSTTMSVIWPLLYTRVVNFNEEHTVCKYTLPSWKQDRKGGINGGGGGLEQQQNTEKVITQKALKVVIYKKLQSQ